ncbi:MAG: FecR domain-containing protein [Rikenellaceae bacterium]|nr:FecR domain-containing protein [Rikenellaceae bacterium]MCL2692007.1 FecR domain-containing protein [Rikenellaceae bacterium]
MKNDGNFDPTDIGRIVRMVQVTRMWDAIDEQRGLRSVRVRIIAYRRRMRLLRVAASSAAVVLIAAIALFVNREDMTSIEELRYAERKLIEIPGVEMRLTTASGDEYVLSDVMSEVAIGYGGSLIRKEGGVLYVLDMTDESDADVHEIAVEKISMRIPRGMEQQVILPDDSRVWLSAESQFTFPSRFTDGVREVEVSGEACFEVIHDASRPFIVRSGATTTEVLGTTFIIYNYPEDRMITTTLLEGSIRQSFGDGSRPVTLFPSQQLRYGVDDGSVAVTSIDREDYRAYREGRIVFRDRMLTDIVASLERTFDYRIEMSDDVRDARHTAFTITVNKSENIDTPLDKLMRTGAFRYEIHGNVISLY